ncbi:VOC family protein [Aeromonas dhakensis]|uniref:VOC family protein n=1 Tax=Aeromonas dhakensis TaxID=196024 RepID=UPI003B9DDCE3
MTIHAIDHVTLRTDQLEQTIAFYRDAIGLQEGRRPPFPFPGCWLYAGGRPLLHIVANTQGEGLTDYLGRRETEQGSGCIYHISLSASDPVETRARLLRLEVPFVSRVIPERNELQLFLRDNNGVPVELLFTQTDIDQHDNPTTGGDRDE